VIYEAIGLGLVMGLIFTEVLGVAAGGLIVPGYIALYLDQPWRLLGTALAAVLTYGVVNLLGRFILLYGRRTLVLSVLVGFFFGLLTRYLLVFNAMLGTGLDVSVVRAIGYIIPGLIAYWMHRQGVLSTLAAMVMAAFLVRLALILTHGGRLLDVAIR